MRYRNGGKGKGGHWSRNDRDRYNRDHGYEKDDGSKYREGDCLRKDGKNLILDANGKWVETVNMCGYDASKIEL